MRRRLPVPQVTGRVPETAHPVDFDEMMNEVTSVPLEGAALLMRLRRTYVAVALAAAFVVALIIGALGGIWDGPSSYGDRIDALVERTCEIVRDIAGDAAAGVDTVSQTRDRLKHLLDGYGVTAPVDIQTPLRNTVAAMTNTTRDASLGRLESACSARGF